MTNTALVTGASSGIGREFARYHAERGGDLIITARRDEALSTLKAELEQAHGVTVRVFAQDLASSEHATALYERIKATGLTVDILINNAGFGGQGRHIERPLDDEIAMIDLNVQALVTLTHHVAQDMVKRGAGRILNVASTAAFMPGPNQAVYFATKAFVKSYSEALAQELRKSGVSVTVLAPGYVETEFADRSGLTGTKLVSGGGKSARSVARHGYDAMLREKLVTINEPLLGFLLNWIIPFLPRRTVLGMIERMQAK